MTPSSNSVGPRLTAITEITELQQLRDLYNHDWPHHCVGYYCLDNFIGWLKRQQLHSTLQMKNLHIFTLDNDWHDDGLVLIVDRYQLFVHSLHNANERLTTALSLLDWTGGYKVSSFLERHRPSVLKVVQAKDLILEYDSLTLMYYMPAAEALQLEVKCPPGYKVQPLNEENDTELINNLWPNKHQGSKFLIQRLIAWNANMGVYTDDTNELVAWCLRLQGGFLGALQVKDSHKRKGLGTLVARALTRKLGEQGNDVMALVNKDNIASRGMFDKLGFQVTDTCYWLRTFATEEGREWPEGE